MIRIGVICPSEIAFRRFMPALSQISEYEYIGVAVANALEWSGVNEASDETAVALKKENEKAQQFVTQYGGKIYQGYQSMLEDGEIDAIYLPLPPALHYKWAKLALQNGKHVMVEKPSSTCANDTRELIALARQKNLALHENYMFAYHNQLEAIQELMKSGRIGDIRLFRLSFGFPRRAQGDFRYHKALGGGALLDCGGYTIKYTAMLLDETAQLQYANLHIPQQDEVDIYGSAAYVDAKGNTMQLSFGMDNQYRCELEVWGSKGILRTGRVLTAPAGFTPTVEITCGNETVTEKLPADDTFAKSLEHMMCCVQDEAHRTEEYSQIMQQAERVQEFMDNAKVYNN